MDFVDNLGAAFVGGLEKVTDAYVSGSGPFGDDPAKQYNTRGGQLYSQNTQQAVGAGAGVSAAKNYLPWVLGAAALVVLVFVVKKL